MEEQKSTELPAISSDSPSTSPGKVVRRGKSFGVKSPSKSQSVTDLMALAAPDGRPNSRGSRSSPREGSNNFLQLPQKAVMTRHHTVEGDLPSRPVLQLQLDAPSSKSIRRRATVEGDSPTKKRSTLAISKSDSFLAPLDAESRRPRRHRSINEAPSQALEAANVPQRYSTIEGDGHPQASRSSTKDSCTSSSSRMSFAGALAGAPAHQKSVLDMSPRTARRYLIHQHRLSTQLGGDSRSSQHDSRSGQHHRGFSPAASPPPMGAVPEHEGEEADHALCGFLVGDAVTAQRGPDAEGPWHGADGVVKKATIKKREDHKNGFLNVAFEMPDGSTEIFDVRATNLYNITEPSRSGRHMKEARGITDEKMARHGGAKRSGRKHHHSQQQSTVAARIDLTAAEDALAAAGFEVGDEVASIDLAHGCFAVMGVVVSEGYNPGDVLVRVGELGIRSFRALELQKIKPKNKCSPEELALRARRAADIDDMDERGKRPKDGQRGMCLTLDDIKNGEFKNDRKGDRKLDDENRVKKVQVMSEATEFRRGMYVKVKAGADREEWRQFGVGFICALGARPGTVEIQFQSGGDAFTLHTDQLELADEATEVKRFRKPGEGLKVPKSKVPLVKTQSL